MIDREQTIANQAADLKRLSRECNRLRADLVLHPDGRCGCASEGRCQWCRLIAAEERLDLRPNVPAMDDVIGKRIPVLGNQCWIEVVDYMGDDAAVVQAARVSYGEGTRKVRGDRALIRYLLSHRHTTPFEMVELKIVCRVPMDVWRQWIRHRTASVNEYSTRYSEAIDACFVTAPGEWRPQSEGNKQGSAEEFLPLKIGEILSREEEALHLYTRNVYEVRLENGVAREQARKDLPLSTMTEAYWKIDGHNLLHFLGLRLDPHAQREIRAFAVAIGEVVEKWLPMVWEAFVDFRRDALILSGPEVELLRRLFAHAVPGHFDVTFGNLTGADEDFAIHKIGKRGLVELEGKLRRLGLVP